jgi:ribosomal protein S18 acetylase RimI-like enzyme
VLVSGAGGAGPATVEVRVVEHATSQDAGRLWPVYDAVFHDWPGAESWREEVWDRHRVREGFRLALAHRDERLVGFAYGYTGRTGQWWTDHAREVLAPDVARDWLGGHFELVSIAVLQPDRGSGIGARLLRSLTRGLVHERWLLMTTADASDPARRLYDSHGWRVIGPGIGEATVIMGRRRGSRRSGPGSGNTAASTLSDRP